MSRNMPPSRTRKVLRIFLALATLLALTFVALHLWAWHRLAGEVRAVAERGETLSLEALLPRLPPGDRNASDALDAIIALIRLAPEDGTLDGTVKDIRLDLEPKAKTLEQARRLLAIPEHRLALEVLDLSAGIEHARYLRGDGDAPGLPALVQNYNRVGVLRLMHLLRARALLATYDERPAEAYRDIAHHLRLASWLEEELPLAISRLLSLAAADRGLELLEQLQQRSPPSPATHARLDAELSRLEAWSPAHAFAGERAYLYQASARASQFLLFFSPQDASPWQRFSRQFLSRWFDLFQTAAFLRFFAEFLDHISTAPHERPPWQSTQGTVADILIPNMLEGAYKMDGLQARLRMARIALAWSTWTEAEGSAPSSLADLVPGLLAGLPPDPFSNGPFVVQPDGHGGRLESVGRDQQDGGHGGDDLVWRLPGG